jgi:hypothetical protein
MAVVTVIDFVAEIIVLIPLLLGFVTLGASVPVCGIPAKVASPRSPVGTVAGKTIDGIVARMDFAAWISHVAAWIVRVKTRVLEIRAPQGDIGIIRFIMIEFRILIRIPVIGQDHAHGVAPPLEADCLFRPGRTVDYPVSMSRRNVKVSVAATTIARRGVAL